MGDWRRIGLLLLLLGAIQSPAVAASFDEAMGLFAAEKVSAENDVAVLKLLQEKDTAAFIRGIRLYGAARSAFENLLTTLKSRVSAGDDIRDDDSLRKQLSAAVEQRLALSRHISQAIEKNYGDEGLKGAGGVAAGAEVVSNLLGAAVDIWRAYQEYQTEQREQLRDQLDALKWKSFAELAS